MSEEEKRPEAQEETGAEKRDTSFKGYLKRFWKEYGDMVVTLAAVFVVFKFIFQLAWIPTGSMETTLPTKSLVLGWHIPYLVADPLPEYGNIVTFWSDELDEVLVKRVIGLPGDIITYDDLGNVYRNGEKLEEPYLAAEGITYCAKEFAVPEDCFFVMGDNRSGSYDARMWQNPYIPAEKVQARVFLCFSIGSTHAWQGVHWVA